MERSYFETRSHSEALGRQEFGGHQPTQWGRSAEGPGDLGFYHVFRFGDTITWCKVTMVCGLFLGALSPRGPPRWSLRDSRQSTRSLPHAPVWCLEPSEVCKRHEPGDSHGRSRGAVCATGGGRQGMALPSPFLPASRPLFSADLGTSDETERDGVTTTQLFLLRR